MPFFIGIGVIRLSNNFYEALLRREDVSDWLFKARDLTCLRVAPQWQLVVACDSLGGIGQKPLDLVQAAPETVGHFSLRVPLLEVICAGARPFLIIDTLSVEAGAYGQAILAGIKALAAEAGLIDDVHFNGSTEKNVLSQQTGLGVTVVGMADSVNARLGTSMPGDLLLLVGLPKSAPAHDVRIGDPDIVTLREVEWLRAQNGVHDMVPVGSRGVAEEAHQLAEYSRTTPILDGAFANARDSGGPHTSVLVACSAEIAPALIKKLHSPIQRVGRLAN